MILPGPPDSEAQVMDEAIDNVILVMEDTLRAKKDGSKGVDMPIGYEEGDDIETKYQIMVFKIFLFIYVK